MKSGRSISDIAQEIEQHWSKVNYAAKPYFLVTPHPGEDPMPRESRQNSNN
jgi:hypothetical protein